MKIKTKNTTKVGKEDRKFKNDAKIGNFLIIILVLLVLLLLFPLCIVKGTR
jgi:hypothetical protein